MKDTIIRPKQQTDYKYRINELLNLLTRPDYDLAIKKIPELLGVAYQTFWRMRNIPKGDKASPTTDQLLIISEYFSQYFPCTPNDLIIKDIEK
jgi:hypothetical protein